MPTGNISYWNGFSGWIKQTYAPDVPTNLSNDLIFTAGDISSGTPVLGAAVDYTVSPDGPWLATALQIS